MPYTNPGGYNFGPMNLDGYGISLLSFIVVYTVFLLAACAYLWLQRNHPVLKMRKVSTMLMAVLTLHVFAFVVFTVYPLNGGWPCAVEFWAMSVYLPLGIGLWQIQNQQLLMVSRQQTELMESPDTYKNLLPPRKGGLGSGKYWMLRFKMWYQGISTKGKYEGFVFIGMIVQLIVSLVVYNISRKFNSYGIVSQPTLPGQCRRGWEWIPSVVWQFIFNFFFGPYLLFKIRNIRDAYQWRLQTIIAVIAGLPGTPIWFAALYAEKFVPVNKYWLPSMWFAPGMLAMELVTLGFPLYQMRKYNRDARETDQAVAQMEDKQRAGSLGSITVANPRSGSLARKLSGRMHCMEALDSCLRGNYDSLQVYASCKEFNGENIIFLTKVIAFKQAWTGLFNSFPKKTGAALDKDRNRMFRKALNIFVTLVHKGTSPQPINIDSSIYNRLDKMFGSATALVAMSKTSSRTSSLSAASSSATPWDDPQDISPVASVSETFDFFPMRPLSEASKGYGPGDAGSRERIISINEEYVDGPGNTGATTEGDPLESYEVPGDFGVDAFKDAYISIRYMVWTSTWQHYMDWKLKTGSSDTVGSVI
ncbi:MAG: hypothetical protein Q9174_005437 [Haloplaca sp. 1 TL-2023]